MTPRFAACLIAALAVVTTAVPVWAHRGVTGRASPKSAIVIPNLTHGQMSVIAANKAAIMDLADRQMPADPVLRRLQGFISLQQFACMGGLVPGSISDEASPFNECAHGYLAATRALLVHLQGMPGNQAAVQALVGKIENEMLLNQTALTLCRYSDEPFNTAEVIAPHWAAVPGHPPTATTFAGVALAGFGGAWLALRRKAP